MEEGGGSLTAPWMHSYYPEYPSPAWVRSCTCAIVGDVCGSACFLAFCLYEHRLIRTRVLCTYCLKGQERAFLTVAVAEAAKLVGCESARGEKL